MLAFVAVFSAEAQGPPPGGQEAGAQGARFLQDTERKKAALEGKPKIPLLEVKEGEEAAQIPDTVKFTLREVKITGSTIFDEAALRGTYESYIGKTVTFKDLNAIAAAVKDKYRKKGYLTTIVYIPEQEISEGVVQIKVMEGRMGDLKIEGGKYFDQTLIKKYFHVKKNEMLDIRRLQKDLLRVNQTPDLEVKAVLSPGKEPGTSDIVLTVSDKFPYHAGTGTDNQGTRLSGKYRESFFGRSSNLTGVFDTMFVNTVFSKDSAGESLSYVAPLGTYGAKFVLDASNFRMKNGCEYRPYDIIGLSQTLDPHLSIELYLTESLSARMDTGIAIKSVTKTMYSNTISNDQLRMPYFGFDVISNDPMGQMGIEPKFFFSTENFLGASKAGHPTASRFGTGGNFFKYTQGFWRVNKMPFESYLSVKTQLQVASESLPSSEQFQIGGANSVRGYPEGDYLADTGASMSMDWVFPMYLFPKDWKLPYSDMPLRSQLQPAIFADIGGGVLHRVLSGEKRDKFLAGVGAGFRFRFKKNIYLQFDAAEAVGDAPAGGGGPSSYHLTFLAEI